MAEAKQLERFTIKAAADGYRIHIEDQAGDTIEFAASRDQVDLIAETLDNLLNSSEVADEA